MEKNNSFTIDKNEKGEKPGPDGFRHSCSIYRPCESGLSEDVLESSKDVCLTNALTYSRDSHSPPKRVRKVIRRDIHGYVKRQSMNNNYFPQKRVKIHGV